MVAAITQPDVCQAIAGAIILSTQRRARSARHCRCAPARPSDSLTNASGPTLAQMGTRALDSSPEPGQVGAAAPSRGKRVTAYRG